MRKYLLLMASAIVLSSCTEDYLEDFVEQPEAVVENVMEESAADESEEYKTMYAFIENVCFYEDLFHISMPESPTYDDLMWIAASVIMTDEFSDTLGEGEVESVYRLMLAYFGEHEPDSEITNYLEFIIINGLY